MDLAAGVSPAGSFRYLSIAVQFVEPGPQVTQRTTALRATGTGRKHTLFITREGFGERFTCTGLTQRALYCRVIHPAGQRIVFFLKCLQVSFHLYDKAGYLFRTTAEVHPTQLVQLRLQVVYFAFTIGQFFQQSTVQRFLFGQALFQQKDVVRRGVIHKPIF